MTLRAAERRRTAVPRSLPTQFLLLLAGPLLMSMTHGRRRLRQDAAAS